MTIQQGAMIDICTHLQFNTTLVQHQPNTMYLYPSPSLISSHNSGRGGPTPGVTDIFRNNVCLCCPLGSIKSYSRQKTEHLFISSCPLETNTVYHDIHASVNAPIPPQVAHQAASCEFVMCNSDIMLLTYNLTKLNMSITVNTWNRQL